MIGFFLRFLLIIFALWIVRRALGFLVGAGQPAAREPQERFKNVAKGDMVRDPVCGMYMDPRLAIRVDQGKGSFFFCSADCKEKFLTGKQA
jgi:YHS domain-containing protein